MPKYLITSKAGRTVAGHRNSGVGTELDLTEDAAASALERGELHQPGSEPAPETTEDKAPATKATKAKKAEGAPNA